MPDFELSRSLYEGHRWPLILQALGIYSALRYGLTRLRYLMPVAAGIKASLRQRR